VTVDPPAQHLDTPPDPAGFNPALSPA
jgi:hypothetical protein